MLHHICIYSYIRILLIEMIYVGFQQMFFIFWSDDNAYLFTTKFSHYHLTWYLRWFMQRSRLEILKILKSKVLRKPFESIPTPRCWWTINTCQDSVFIIFLISLNNLFHWILKIRDICSISAYFSACDHRNVEWQ